MSAAIKESKHTPGPWTCDEQGNIGTRKVDVAYTVRDGECVTPLNVANAKLIAAAPAMADALHSARCALDVFLSGELSDASAVERLASAAVIVNAALAKAGL